MRRVLCDRLVNDAVTGRGASRYLVGALLIAACTSPVVPPIAVSPTPSASACPDFASVITLPAASVAPTPVPSRPMPLTPPPGRMVFRSGDRLQTLQIYEGGRVRELALPSPAMTVRLSLDGSRVGAVLGDATPQTLWMLSIGDGVTTQRGLTLPAAAPQEYELTLSPDLSWVFYVPSLAVAQSEMYLVDASTGVASPAAIAAGWLHDAQWTATNELVLLTGPLPENNASPQSRPGGLRPMPNGRIAYVAMTPSNAPLIRMLGNSVPLLAPEPIFATKEGCALQYRSDLRMRPPDLSADSAFIAVVGAGNNLSAGFVAMRATLGGPVGVFRAPTTSCFIQQSAWSGPHYLVMLTGPNCGETTLTGRLVVLDRQARVEAEYVVDRKAFFVPSTDGHWVASATGGGWQFIQLDVPSARIVVPLSGTLDGWCCP
jgi:hypothetical protein